MIIYTSGTTGKPKGVVSSFKNIEAQVKAMQIAWKWRPTDHIINVLPLHHVHGIVNVVTTAISSGATLEMIKQFKPDRVWNAFVESRANLFMAVPTVYSKLLSYYNEQSEFDKTIMNKSCSRFRLMVSGSASLPTSLFKKWKEISGHDLLERFYILAGFLIFFNL